MREASPALPAGLGRNRKPQARRFTALSGGLSKTAGLVLAVCLLALVAATSIAVGSAPVALDEAVSAITAANPTDDQVIVRELRGPRTVVGLLVGAALGCAGALIQGLTRNPLADPWILGIEAGAAFAVVCGIFLAKVASASDYAWFALGGAAIAWAVVYVIGSGSGSRATPLNLTLAGSAVMALLTALTSAVIVLDAATLNEYRFWIVGSLADRGLEVARELAPFFAVGLVIALLSGKALNGLALGDDVARGLGQRVVLSQAAIAIGAVLLAGAAVALAGPIGFVGLVVPHVARAIAGPDYRWLIPYSAVLGAILILSADIIGRVIAPPGEVQVGIVMAVIGAPLFIALVRRRRLAGL